MMLFAVILAIISLGFVMLIPDIKRMRDTMRNPENADMNFNEYCYSISMSREEAMERLSRWNITDPIKYEFEPDEGIITFISDLPDGTPPEKYRVEITEGKLHVSKINRRLKGKVRFGYRLTFQFTQNEFWSKKLGAVPAKYTKME